MIIENIFSLLKTEHPNINLPQIRDIEDYNYSQILVGGKWSNYYYSCGIVVKDGNYVYVETDDDRGYVLVIKQCGTEEEIKSYVLDRFTILANASDEDDSREQMMARYLQKNHNLSEVQANQYVDIIACYSDVFDEFFNYIRIKKMCKEDGTRVSVDGVTAEKLVMEKKCSVPEAYLYLTDLLD